MKILGGKLKGKTLATCRTGAIRPAMALVRKSIFDTLGTVEGLSILDLCAGTGCLGIEAMSRGANDLTLVDMDRDAIRIIFKNIELCGLSGKVISGRLPLILHRRVFEAKKFDIIFFDPPYGQGKFIEETLIVIAQKQICTESGLIIIETEKKCDFNLPDNLKLKKAKIYGNTKVTFLQSAV